MSKTITLQPRAGNPPPRLWETPAGLINSIGLPNKGLDGYLSEDLPQLAELTAGVSAHAPELAAARAGAADHERHGRQRRGARRAWSRPASSAPEIAAIELNVSCPNVKTGLDIGADPAPAARRSCARSAAAPPSR